MGSGKSTVLNILKELGFDTCSADELIIEVIYTKYIKELEPIVGKEAIINGRIDRATVSAAIYKNRALYKELSDAIHPLIDHELLLRKEANKGILFMEVPFLLEGNHQHVVDKILCVYADRTLQLKNLYARGLTDADITAREAHHFTIEHKIATSDYQIKIQGTKADTRTKVLALLRKLPTNP